MGDTKVTPHDDVRTFRGSNESVKPIGELTPWYPDASRYVGKEYLAAIKPSLPKTEIECIGKSFNANKIDMLTLCHLDHSGLEAVGVTNPTSRARIMASLKRPTCFSQPPPGERPKVIVRFGVVKISNVDTVNACASVISYIDCYWTDPRLVGIDPDAMPADIWRPDINVYNVMGEMDKHVHAPRLVNSSTGLVLGAFYVQGTISLSLGLRDFPFDSCIVPLKVMQVEEDNIDKFQFITNHESGKTENGGLIDVKSGVSVFSCLPDSKPEITDWHLNGWSMCSYDDCGGDRVTRSVIIMWIHAERMSGYYIWKVVVPLWCVCVLNWSLFLYDVGDLDARVNCCITMFLATAALLYVVSESLPKTDFLTRLDKLIVMTLTVQVFATVETWICALLVNDLGLEQLAQQIDFFCCIGLPAIVVMTNLFLFGKAAFKCCCPCKICLDKGGLQNIPPCYTSKGRSMDEAVRLYGEFTPF